MNPRHGRAPRASASSPGRDALCLTVASVLLFVLPSCKDDLTVPAGEPHDTGIVAAVGRDVGPGDPDGDGLLSRIHVKTDPADPNECGVIYDVYGQGATVATLLRIREVDDSLRPATVDDLTVGAEVRVWHTGAIAESCPAQGVATTVEIVEG